MTKTRTAACSCGQLTARVTGDPVRISICHCLACQRRTGGPFGEQARFSRAQVETSGVSTAYERTGDAGGTMQFHFCPRCGSTVYYHGKDDPTVGIPVGAFADPTFPTPTISIYEERMHSWVVPPPDAQHIA